MVLTLKHRQAVTASGTMDGQKVLAQINGTPPYALPDHNNSVVFAQEGLSFSSHVLSLSYGVSTPVLVPNSGFAVTGVEITMGDGDERWALVFHVEQG
jgi:hypothetical protein